MAADRFAFKRPAACLARLRVFPCLLVLIASLVLEGCSYTNAKSSQSVFVFGTVCAVTLFGSQEQEVYERVFQRWRQIDTAMSRQLDRSDVARVNAASGKKAVAVSEDTFLVIDRGLAFSAQSGGRFDITVGPLVDLWDIGGKNPKVPTERAIQERLSRVGYRKVVLEPGDRTVFLTDEGMMLDLGGIAKGFAADEAVSMLNAAGVKGGIVDVGGNIVVVGQKPDGSPWRIGIQHPTEPRGKYCGIVEIEGGCVVTSGVYERYFELDGKRYHHILDTETGYPVEGPLLSVSLLARDSLTADALSTAVFAAGLPAGHELVLKTDGLEAIFILKGLRVLVTPGLRDTFTLTDPSFELAESGN